MTRAAPTAVLIILLCACGSTQVKVTQKLSTKLGSFREVVVRFPLVYGDPLKDKERSHLSTRMALDLHKSGKFAKVSSFEATAEEFGDLLIDCNIVNLKRVDVGDRVMSGAAGDQAAAELVVVLKDIRGKLINDGKAIGTFRVAAEAPGATAFSGWTMNALENAVDAAVEQILSSL
jgi:hypothetical protein